MGLGRLVQRAEAPRQQSRSAGAVFETIIDGNPINNPLQVYGGGLALPAAWRASMKISQAIGTVPWDLWRFGRDSRRRLPRPLVLEAPDSREDRVITLSAWALDVLWDGNGIGIYGDRDRDGVPQTILPIPANEVGIRRIGRETGTISALPIGAVRYQIAGREYGRDEIFHIKGPCRPGDVRGWGVLEAHLNGWNGATGTLDLALSLQKQAAEAGAGDGIPSGILKSSDPEMDEGDARKMRRQWYINQQRRQVQVLNSSTEFTPLAWNPDELQLIEARKMSLLETALVFGMEPSDLGAETSSRTYKNDNAVDVKFVKWGLRGHLAWFEAALSGLWPDPALRVLPDLDDYTRPDELTRAQIGEIQIRSKVRTPNEKRAEDGLTPLEGGDDFPATAPTPPQNNAGGNENDGSKEGDPGQEGGGENPEDIGPDDSGIGG